MKKLELLLVAFAIVAIGGCGGDDALTGLPEVPDLEYGGGDFLQLMDYQGRARGYTVHIPTTASEDVAAPLLIMLHGVGQDAPGLRSLAGIEEHTDDLGWIVVYPDGIDESWAVGTETSADVQGVDDVGFIDRMIDRIDARLNIDRERVFAAGLSNGALMTHRLACELGGDIRGIASVAGAMYTGLASGCNPSRPVPAMFINGDDDDFFPWGGFPAGGGERIMGVLETVDWWAVENGCGSPVTTDLPDVAADGTTVELIDYVDCTSGAPVRLYAVENGGHTWPGRGGIGRTSLDIDGNVEILGFFGASLP
ncbi:MAG: PHB depolymerase family esterase [Gemmatimonadota bacterium]|nr:PHB depolymerase family esterase [Gemmatimonadota bacterium]